MLQFNILILTKLFISGSGPHFFKNEKEDNKIDYIVLTPNTK